MFIGSVIREIGLGVKVASTLRVGEADTGGKIDGIGAEQAPSKMTKLSELRKNHCMINLST